MEAPKKIYLEKVYPDNGVLPNGLNYNRSPNDIEYTRTDAFIEKAKNWLNEHISDYECEPMGEYPRLAMLDDFEDYMKGE